MPNVLQHLAKTALSAPLPNFRARPLNDRGQPLDAQLHRMLGLMGLLPSLDQLGPERARREMRVQSRLGALAKTSVHQIRDARVPTPEGDVPVRIYTPRETHERLPATLYFHGGGFVIGDLESHDSFCRHLAVRSGSIVVAVDYRLAPEHPFPCATDDACHAFEWTLGQADALGIDPARVAVAGDSAGGNLAAVVTQVMRDRGGRAPSFQLLIYPALDFTRSLESHRTFRVGYFLTEALMDWFLAHYVTDPAHLRNPLCSPLITRELAGLPPAHIVTAGFDPLRDEGEAYADALRAAGVKVTDRCYDTLIHGFISMAGLVDAARHAGDDIAEVLRQALWP